MDTPALPQKIDPSAMCQAFLDEGFIEVTDCANSAAGVRTFWRRAPSGDPSHAPQAVSVPVDPALLSAVRGEGQVEIYLHRCMERLLAVSSDPHLEVGPRNPREAAMLAEICRLRAALAATPCPPTSAVPQPPRPRRSPERSSAS